MKDSCRCGPAIVALILALAAVLVMYWIRVGAL